jgi:uncharacterized NAD(P)/FAD-binding protein YdhS
VTIVGGGLSGAAAAIQLSKATAGALEITIVEPRAELGRGLAYAGGDPDHRLNGTPESHSLDPEDPAQVRRWIDADGLLARDPEAVAANGNVFMRRGDYGRYVGEMVRRERGIRHVRDTAIDLDARLESPVVHTALGEAIASDLLVVATGNPLPRLPAAVRAHGSMPAATIEDPFALDRIRALPSEARVLVLGSGLTALDVVSTLLRQGHRGAITVASRRGLRPRPHRAAPASGASLLERIEGPVPDFVRSAGSPPSLRLLARALRRRIHEAQAAGGDWYGPFDEMRDVVWRFWPRVSAAEKRRFLRRLRPWYDAHRFRAPPQNDAMVREAEREGRVRFVGLRGSDGLDSHLRGNDVVINCTGLDPTGGLDDNPFLASLTDQGILSVDPSGVGFTVDAQCRPIGRGGTACERIRLIGPPTAGVFGDPLGVLFIVPQVRRILPGMLATLRATALAHP